MTSSSKELAKTHIMGETIDNMKTNQSANPKCTNTKATKKGRRINTSEKETWKQEN